MIDLKKIQALLQLSPSRKDYPKHVIVNLFPAETTEERKKEDFERFVRVFDDVVNVQLDHKIPILTVSLGAGDVIFDRRMFIDYLERLEEKACEHKVNVTVFGKWYSLSGNVVEALKKIDGATKEFDSFFLNICLNYNPKEEISDACRLIVRKILLEKMDADSITPEILKENIYSSYFIPADLVIEPTSRFTGTFLWDSHGAKIHFLRKPVLDITKSDILKSLDYFAGQN